MKEKIVTRTITRISVLAIGMDSNDMPTTKRFIIPDMPDEKIKAYVLSLADDSFTPCKVKEWEKIEKLYGMIESKFIANAVELPPRKDYSNEKES